MTPQTKIAAMPVPCFITLAALLQRYGYGNDFIKATAEGSLDLEESKRLINGLRS